MFYFILLTTFLVIFLTFFKWRYAYWLKIGLPQLEPTIPFGNMKEIFFGRKAPCEQLWDFYREIRARGLRHAGIYMGPKPFYFPVDPEILKSIMIKDFQHFSNHGNYSNIKHDPLSGTLFNLENEKWREMRIKLTPTFTSGKMKMMFSTLLECGKELKIVMDEMVKQNVSFEIKDILARYGTDVIGSVAFGLECNSLKNPDSQFRYYGRRISENTYFEIMYILLQFLLPFKVLDLIKYKFTKPDVENFFMKVVKDTVDYPEKNQIYRQDMMHLLIQLKNRGEILENDDKSIEKIGNENHITLEELTAQAYVFFVAGFETSTTLVNWVIFELSVNSKIQEKLRQEIQNVIQKYNGQLTYDGMVEMTYLDKVVHETLRKYPPLAMMQRRCTQDYQIPGTDIILKEGTDVVFSNMGVQMDPEYYPDPEKFDPERFNEEEKKKRPPCTWIPFGDGPRHCIGMRFALMQSKVAIITILRNYKVELSPKTQLPIKLKPSEIFVNAVGGLWFNMSPI